MATAVAVGALLVSSNQQQKKAARAERRQRDIANRRAEVRTGRERKRRLAQLRVQRAEIRAQGVASGAAGSSAEEGTIAGATSSTRGAIGAGNLEQGFAGAIATQQNIQANALGRAATFQALATLPASFGQNNRGGNNPSGTQ